MNRHRTLGLLAILLLPLAACQSERICTAIGTPVGIQVDVAPPLAGRVAAAEMEVCQAGACRPARLELFVAGGGGSNGFGDVRGLSKEPARVALKLTSPGGDTLVDRRVEVVPRGRYPNGPDCGEGGPNARVVVDGDGTLREVP
ncbi:hypothetical protein [Nonomuraea typhae]|uniref:hypothetical protein n=1 Tax=Nonomuraea typhae TaxID=2603600 RepID=UPI0012FCA927|nr:hypothetical protein [Nonomuraea typhae]